LDLTGLILSIYDATINIDAGRKGFATRGKAEEGRLAYERGIVAALSAFRDARSTADPQTIALVEYTFLSMELQFCDETDTDTLSSLTQAIQSFDDAFRVLEVVEDAPLYQGVEKSYPRTKKYRVNGFPKDSFHIACIAHKTRLQNILRTPGMDKIEKALLKQRFANLSAAQSGYMAKQKTSLPSSSQIVSSLESEI